MKFLKSALTAVAAAAVFFPIGGHVAKAEADADVRHQAAFIDNTAEHRSNYLDNADADSELMNAGAAIAGRVKVKAKTDRDRVISPASASGRALDITYEFVGDGTCRPGCGDRKYDYIQYRNVPTATDCGAKCSSCPGSGQGGLVLVGYSHAPAFGGFCYCEVAAGGAASGVCSSFAYYSDFFGRTGTGPAADTASIAGYTCWKVKDYVGPNCPTLSPMPSASPSSSSSSAPSTALSIAPSGFPSSSSSSSPSESPSLSSAPSAPVGKANKKKKKATKAPKAIAPSTLVAYELKSGGAVVAASLVGVTFSSILAFGVGLILF